MEDDTASMDAMIFDNPAQKLVAVAAEELGEVKGDVISAVISSQQRRAFIVTFSNECFVVKHVLNNDQLQLSVVEIIVFCHRMRALMHPMVLVHK